MNCKKAALLLSSYVDGEVTGVESQLIRSHLHDCQECAQKVRELRVVRSIMKIEPRDVSIPEGLEQRLVASMPKPQKRFVLAGALAATALVATFMFPAMSKPVAPSVEQNRQDAIQQELARDQMATFGSDPTEGASLVHYANLKNTNR